MKVAVRADASVDIGSGHVMRCLALAEGLRARGAEVVFVCRAQPGDLLGRIAAQGFAVRSLAPDARDQDADAQAVLAALGGERVDWLVVDHYQLDAHWEHRMRAAAGRILAIDDLADRPHASDLLLDQNLHLDGEQRYRGLVTPACATLLGPQYALLRPEFARMRAGGRRRDGSVRRVLCFFGGSDAGNQTAVALDALALLGRPGIAVDVVVGGGNPHRDDIARRCLAIEGASLACDVNDMAERMNAADVCIGAGGSTTWERCCLGLPAVLVAVADNQVKIAQDCDRIGAAIYAGEAATVSAEGLARLLEELFTRRDRLVNISRTASSLVDGLGVQRVAGHMIDKGVWS
ncbi:MAG: UDP-2,4-diacetamido-2,4,6-trideoxy-beta-L-altropyranose hydrolase [Telluria sp.]